MKTNRKPYARYFIVRGHQALWLGDAAEDGSRFRQFVITSNEFNSTEGTFQVYGLEGVGRGIKDGRLAVSEQEPQVLFDEDFKGLSTAVKRFTLLIEEAVRNGFRQVTLLDELEFQSKLRGT